MQKIKEGIVGKKSPEFNQYAQEIQSSDDPEYRAYLYRMRQNRLRQNKYQQAKQFYENKQGVVQRVGNYLKRNANYQQRSAIGREFGVRVPKQGYQGKKGYAGRGRPRGPSGKYYVPGKGAVGVYEFRKFIAQQRLAQKMQQSQAYKQYPNQQQYQEQPNYPPQVPRYPPVQPSQPFQQQPIQEKPQGVNLTGGFELLKVSMNGNNNAPVKSVWDVDTPQDYGDYYTEPDFLSGKQVLSRRTRSMPKW